MRNGGGKMFEKKGRGTSGQERKLKYSAFLLNLIEGFKTFHFRRGKKNR